MKPCLALLLLAGVCASADAASKLIWQVSTDNGTTWQAGTTIPVYSNTTVKVRCVVDWTGTTAYGLSGLSQYMFIDNVDPNDAGVILINDGSGNRLSPFTSGGLTMAARLSGTTRRLVALGAGWLEGPVSIGQFARGTGYSTANPAPIFAFDYVIGPAPDRTLVFRSDVATIRGVPSAFGYHASDTSQTTSFRESGTVQPAQVSVVFDPGCQVTQQPSDIAGEPGKMAMFNFGFSDPQAKYQWRFSGVPLVDDGRIFGSQSPTLLIENVSASDIGQYDCVVSGACFTTASRPASLECRPVFISKFKGGQFYMARPIVLDARAIQTDGVTYQWYRDGAALADSDVYSGSQSGVLTITATQALPWSAFQLVASTGCGTTTSSSAGVQVFCTADFTKDGKVTEGDLSGFLQYFREGLSEADANGDGFLDFTDVDAFVQAYERGC